MNFEQEMEALVEKFAELLVGDSSPETVQKVKLWSIYNQIYKTMPNLTTHFTQTHPEAKAEIRRLFEEIKELNQKLRDAGKPQTSSNE